MFSVKNLSLSHIKNYVLKSNFETFYHLLMSYGLTRSKFSFFKFSISVAIMDKAKNQLNSELLWSIFWDKLFQIYEFLKFQQKY